MAFQYVRDFVEDKKLHLLLDDIEAFVGYRLTATPMPESYRPKAHASIGQHGDESFDLWYIESELPDQTTLCHELGHVVCWLSGAVTSYDINPSPVRYCSNLITEGRRKIWEYMQHVPVHSFVAAMGYEERPLFDPVVRDALDSPHSILKIDSRVESQALANLGRVVPGSLNLGADQMFYLTGFLLRLLSLPQQSETRADLHRLASSCCPQALARASAILEDRGERLLLDPEDYRAHLQAIFRIAGLPSGNLIFSSVGKTDPNYYSRSLARATGGTDIPQK